MKKTDQSAELFVQPERSQYKFLLAKNANYFGTLPESKLKPVLKLIADTSYEQLTCVGYNPDTTNMEATFSIKKPFGYSGDLCHLGSFEYVRFYLDFHDGSGFIDQGSVAVNVHDIPDKKDCHGQSIFPIHYVATLKKKTPKFSFCDSPLLPTLRAILSWSVDPPVNSPNWLPTWGGRMDCDVQLKPYWKFPLHPVIDLSNYFTLALTSPNLTVKQLSEITEIDINQLMPQAINNPISDLLRQYEQAKVPPLRTVYKTVFNMMQYPTSEITLKDKLT